MMEINPRNIKSHNFSEPRIVLGSFPTWTISKNITGSDDNEREIQRINNGDSEFYFGSSVNKFWEWYQKYLDGKIIVDDISSITKSLTEKSIAVTDLIVSCERKGKSSLDRDLKKRVYNHEFFNYPSKNMKLKLLCTSKGILDKMLLNKHFFKCHPNLIIDEKLSFDLTKQILSKLDVNPNELPQNIAKVFRVKNKGIIECLSIPSPGSPYRNLVRFGMTNENSNNFLDEYLRLSFNWFTK